jgi:hypothetical protein
MKRPRRPSPEAQEAREILLAVARNPRDAGDLLSDLNPALMDTVLRAGTVQGLGTCLVACLQAARAPVPAWLESHRFDLTVHRATILRALATIAPALTAADVPWLVLKGPVIAKSADDPELREFKDIDLLVSGASLRGALDVLEIVGVDAMNRNWGTYLRYGVAEFPVLMSGTPVDLHWHLIGLRMIRKRFRIPIEDLLERREMTAMYGISFPSLDAEDALIQVALHAGLSGATRIGWLRDVHLMLSGSVLDWDSLVARSRRYGAAGVVGHVLDRCRVTLGSPVPPKVPEQLTPRSALIVRRALDARPPPHRVWPEDSFSGFFVATSRAGRIETVGRAQEILRDRVGSWIGRPPRWSAYDPRGPLYWARESGGANGLQRYLEFASEPERLREI